jgi:hypothetical protein
MDAAVGTWRRMVAARGYIPARREWGCVHTEHAVGRHRPMRSKAVSRCLYQRTGIRKDEDDGMETGESWGKFSRARLTTKQPRKRSPAMDKRNLVPDRGQGALTQPKMRQG